MQRSFQCIRNSSRSKMGPLKQPCPRPVTHEPEEKLTRRTQNPTELLEKTTAMRDASAYGQDSEGRFIHVGRKCHRILPSM